MRKTLLVSLLACTALIGNAELKHISKQPSTVHSVSAKELQKATKLHSPKKADATEYIWGYGSEGDECYSLGVGEDCTYRPLVKFTSDLATKYAGNKIKALKFYVGDVSDTQVTALIADAMDASTFLSSETATITPESWNTVELSSPYTIEAGSEFYIGYDVKGGADNYPIGVYDSSSKATPDNSIVGYYIEGEGWDFFVDNYSLASLGYSHCAILAVMEGDNFPKNDLALVGGFNYDICEPGAELEVDLQVSNEASNAVGSFDIVYTLNGGAEVVESVTDAELGAGDIGYYALKLPAMAEGVYSLDVKVANPNGVADTDDSNNSWSSKFEVAQTFPRTTLIENFTTTMCPNCPSAHERLHAAVDAADDLILVAHHSGYYTTTDKMNNSMHDAYLKFFGTNGSYAPAMMVDRTNIDPLYGTGDEGPATYVYTEPYLTMILDELKAFPTKHQVSVVPTYNADTRELKVDVTAQMNGVESDTYVNVFVVEDGIVASQSGGSSNYVHNGVTRVNLAGNWGEKLQWTNGEATKSYTYTIPSSYVDSNMSVVAFVGNYNESDINDCKVYNATKASVIDLSGVSTVASKAAPVVMGGKGQVVIAGNAANVAVYGVDGSLKAQAQGAGSISLTPGLYIVKAGKMVKKVLVK